MNPTLQAKAVVLIDRLEEKRALEDKIESVAGAWMKELKQVEHQVSAIEKELGDSLEIGDTLVARNCVANYLLKVERGRLCISYKSIIDDIKVLLEKKYKRLMQLFERLLEKHSRVSKKISIEKIESLQKVTA